MDVAIAGGTVVEVLVAVFPAHNSVGKAFELVSGETSIEDAVAGL